MPAWRLFLAQVQDVLVLVLLGARVVCAVLREVGDVVTIQATVVMEAILCYRQESRAERALAVRKALFAPLARVGRLCSLPW